MLVCGIKYELFNEDLCCCCKYDCGFRVNLIDIVN